QLGWGGDAEHPSVGRHLFEAAEAGNVKRALDEVRALRGRGAASPAYTFGSFEYSKCAGRLAQHDRPQDAIAGLAQAIELAPQDTDPRELAALRCQRAELLLRSGKRREAREEVAKAAAEDSTSSNVHVLQALAQAPSGTATR